MSNSLPNAQLSPAARWSFFFVELCCNNPIMPARDLFHNAYKETYPIDGLGESGLETFRDTGEGILTEYAEFLGDDGVSACETVFDRLHDRYFLVEVGWENDYRIYGTLIHIDINDGKLWIQPDGTEEGIATELVPAGIPKERIVLAFRPASLRAHTQYAVA